LGWSRRRVLRSQVALAAKGNGPAQRALFDAIQAIEEDRSSGGSREKYWS
jgi:hypothetical protein